MLTSIMTFPVLIFVIAALTISFSEEVSAQPKQAVTPEQLLEYNLSITPEDELAGQDLILLTAKDLSDQLKDPQSAQIRNVFMRKKVATIDGTIFFAICGEINARNGYGGMVGFRKFVRSGRRAGISLDDGTRTDAFASKFCDAPSTGYDLVGHKDFTQSLRDALRRNLGID